MICPGSIVKFNQSKHSVVTNGDCDLIIYRNPLGDDDEDAESGHASNSDVCLVIGIMPISKDSDEYERNKGKYEALVVGPGGCVGWVHQDWIVVVNK